MKQYKRMSFYEKEQVLADMYYFHLTSLDDLVFRDYDNSEYQYYYLENQLYCLRKKYSKVIHIIQATNPYNALSELEKELKQNNNQVVVNQNGNGLNISSVDSIVVRNLQKKI